MMSLTKFSKLRYAVSVVVGRCVLCWYEVPRTTVRPPKCCRNKITFYFLCKRCNFVFCNSMCSFGFDQIWSIWHKYETYRPFGTYQIGISRTKSVNIIHVCRDVRKRSRTMAAKNRIHRGDQPLIITILLLLVLIITQTVMTAADQTSPSCSVEPWGRYSASGGLYHVEGKRYIYSLGGDTQSEADDRGGGVVRTHWRFDLETFCWERLPDTPVSVGYRATATQIGEALYVFGGADVNRIATNDLWKLSLPDHSWTQILSANKTAAGPSARYKHASVRLSDSEVLLLGGREGAAVLSDAWIMTVMNESTTAEGEQVLWTYLGEVIDIYRHAMAWDSQRKVVWIFGGIDQSFFRHDRFWTYDPATKELEEIEEFGREWPGRRASHGLEYVAELDALVMYGGTCGDTSEAYIYNISSTSWCTLAPANRPSLRDAFLWAVDFPYFYIYGGDVICLRSAVYTIADIHRLDLRRPFEWELVYRPFNARAPALTEECTGSNDGRCRTPSFLLDMLEGIGTCAYTPIPGPVPTVVDMSLAPSVSSTDSASFPPSSSSTCSLSSLIAAIVLIIGTLVDFFG